MASYESPTCICMYSICIIFNILLTFELQIYFGSLEISPCMIINFHLPGPRITDLVKSTETCMICVLNDSVCVCANNSWMFNRLQTKTNTSACFKFC